MPGQGKWQLKQLSDKALNMHLMVCGVLVGSKFWGQGLIGFQGSRIGASPEPNPRP